MVVGYILKLTLSKLDSPLERFLLVSFINSFMFNLAPVTSLKQIHKIRTQNTMLVEII